MYSRLFYSYADSVQQFNQPTNQPTYVCDCDTRIIANWSVSQVKSQIYKYSHHIQSYHTVKYFYK